MGSFIPGLRNSIYLFKKTERSDTTNIQSSIFNIQLAGAATTTGWHVLQGDRLPEFFLRRRQWHRV
jgi:hypothetical protein